MKKLFILASILLIIGLSIPAYFTFAAAERTAAFSKVQDSRPPLKVEEVVKLLGQPERIDHAETTGMQGDVYYYSRSNGTDCVIFINSAVFKAEFVPGAKS
jgi:hypothetical protein